MHSWAAMLIEIDKKQEIGLVTSCSKIKDNTLKWHGIVCNYIYYDESHYLNDPQSWNIKKTTEQKFVFWQNDGRNAGKKR